MFSVALLRGALPLATLVLTTLSALAGVPFVTDDPDTSDKGHYEINLAVQATRNSISTSGVFPSLEVNYGVLDNLEAHIAVPIAFDRVSAGNTSSAVGDVEVGVKYRFIDADNYGWRPAVAFAPAIALRTGDAGHGLGSRRTHGSLPVWLSEELERWTIFGGGYNINPGTDNRNFWFAGLGATYEVSPEVIVGAEIFRTTAGTVDGTNGTGFNVGAIFNLSDKHQLLFSVGRNIENAASNNLFLGLHRLSANVLT